MKNFLIKNRYLWFLLIITLGGAYLRFSGLDWGLPWRYHCDENTFINAANAMRKAPHFNYLNPKWFYHPSLSIYIVCLLSAAYSLFAPLALSTVHLLGRFNSAFWGTLSLPMIYLLGKRLYGKLSGILSALFLSVVVIHVQVSHFFTPDIMLVFFLIMTMWFSTGIMRRGMTRDYILAGAACGVGMASKYWAPAILPIVAGYIFRLRVRGFGWRENRRLLAGLFTAGLIFFILSPYVILDAPFAVPRILLWAKKTTGAIPQIWALHFEGTSRYFFQLMRNLPWGMGPPLFLLSLGGLVFITIRHRREDILLSSWIIVNFILIGSWHIKSIRYLLPIIPFLCLAAGELISEMLNRKRFRIPGLVIGLAALLWSATFSFAFIHIYLVKHSKTRASDWIYENLSPGTGIATDYCIPLGGKNELPDDYVIYPLDFNYLFISNLTREQKEEYLREAVSEAEYVILADELWEYYARAGDTYMAERDFLMKLLSGEEGFSRIKTFKTYPQIGDWTMEDDGAELSFHFFDHPAVYLFQKTINQTTPESQSDGRRVDGNQGNIL